MITAQIKNIDLSSEVPWRDFVPADVACFGFYLTASIGTVGEDAGDLFQVLVCTPQWLSEANRRGKYIGVRHFEICGPFDVDTIEEALTKFVENCRGESWQEVVEKLSQKAEWEFEDCNK
jgi:hypothetical protein